MSRLNTLNDLLIHDLKDLYSAETQLLEALPRMAEAANSDELQEEFTHHLGETRTHVKRIEAVLTQLGSDTGGITCKAMQGLIAEGQEIIEEQADEAVKDAALIAAAQKVEHFEIAAYGTVRTYAELLGYDDIVQVLQETLEEEGSTDETLTEVAKAINVEANHPA
jgi:ferritin-like metal-binding protein YciE